MTAPKKSIYVSPAIRPVLDRSKPRGFSAELAAVCEQHARLIQLNTPAFSQERWTRILRALEQQEDGGNWRLLPALYAVSQPRDREGQLALQALTEGQLIGLLNVLEQFRRGDPTLIERIAI